VAIYSLPTQEKTPLQSLPTIGTIVTQPLKRTLSVKRLVEYSDWERNAVQFEDELNYEAKPGKAGVSDSATKGKKETLPPPTKSVESYLQKQMFVRSVISIDVSTSGIHCHRRP